MNTKSKLQEIFRDIFDDEELEIFDEMNAEDLEDWDSLTHIQLIVEIEQEFGIKFTTEEVSESKNVGEFIELINSKIGI